MIEGLGDWRRSQTNGQLRISDDKAEVTLLGWVNRWRDHGGVIFIDLRDRWGVTQVVFDPSNDQASHELAMKLRSEYVIGVKGRVRPRPEGMANPNLPTGEIEVIADRIRVLNTSENLPVFVCEEGGEDERLRLKYRYLELRKERMQRNMQLRSDVNKSMRDFLHGQGFLDMDTPLLAKSTPEGARDFLSPSRLSRGSFYALPQSPQLFKQTLMASGFEKYYQICKCLRDEDLRANRQPEFTQLDLEMSYVGEEQIFSVIERLLAHVYKEIIKVDLPIPFPQITYEDAMLKYGSDKPDLRYGFEIKEVTDIAASCGFGIFEKTAATEGNAIRGINVKGGGAKLSRREIDELISYAQKQGAGGMAWIRVKEGNVCESSIVKFFNPEALEQIRERLEGEEGDLFVFLAGEAKAIAPIFGEVRKEIIRRMEVKPEREWAIYWVNKFPMFEWDAERKGWAPMHHMFTMPRDEDLEKLDSDPGAVYGKLYDLVINGEEIGSGSIRIHYSNLQEKIFEIIGYSKEAANERFGFLLEAFRFGAPPHGGIALGLDRFYGLLLNEPAIRDVIPFPKTQQGTDLMIGAPGYVETEALTELGIQLLPSVQKEIEEAQRKSRSEKLFDANGCEL